ncbi:MAG: TonB-dependent receptor [Myxococcota bacterium]
MQSSDGPGVVRATAGPRVGRSIPRGLLRVLPALVLLGATTGRTQPRTPDPWAGVEEMVVTGSVANEVLTQSSISVAGFDATDLQAIGATDVGDIAEFTPNLEIKSAFASSNPTIFIRGVGLDDSRANASSSVAVLYDDVYMNSPAGQLAQMFDTEKVDVLRGPQGTFFGRNASAGAIRVISNKPSGDFGASLSTTWGRFDQLDVEGMLEAPIVPDFAAIRVSGKLSQRDGYVKNRCAELSSQTPVNRRFTGCSPTVLAVGPKPEKWVNNVNNWAGRSILRLTPLGDDDLELLWNIHGSQSRALSPQFQTIGTAGTPQNPRTGRDFIDPDNCTDVRLVNRRPVCFASVKRPELGNPFEGSFFRTGKEKLDLFGTSVTARSAMGDFELKSISAYEWHDRDADLNLDASPSVSLEPLFTDKAYQLTQDLEATWDPGDGYAATVGGFFLYEHLNVFNIFFNGTGFAALQDQTQRTRYIGAFAHVRWEFSESFRIEGGGRVNSERKTFQITSSTWNSATNSRVASNDLDDKKEVKVTRGSGEVTLTYSPLAEASFYGKYTRGFKGPHFNGAAVRSRDEVISPAKPETVDSFEVGAKTQLFDSAVSFDVAAFYYNYKDQQVFQTRSITDNVIVNELINANDTRVAGVELSLRTIDVVPLLPWIEFPGFSAGFNFAYLYTEYTNFVNVDTKLITDPLNPGTTITLAQIRNYSGNQLVSAPEFNFSGDFSYAIDMGAWGKLTPRLDYSWRSKVYFTVDNQARLGDRSRLLVGSRLTWSMLDGKVEVAGWVRNLTNEVYRVTALNLIGVLNQIDYAFAEPRTYGITGTVRF